MESISKRIYVDVKVGEPPKDMDIGVQVPVAVVDGGEEYPVTLLRVKEVQGVVRCLVQVGEYEYYLYGKAGRWWLVA